MFRKTRLFAKDFLIILTLLNLLAFNLAIADDLIYVCISGENIKVNYSSDPSSLESRIDLDYKKNYLKFVYEPTLVDSKYTIYSSQEYQWWEFIENKQAVGILFESKNDGDILEVCTLENTEL